MKSASLSDLKQFTSNPWWYTVRGVMMIVAGGGIAIFCIIAPDVHLLGERFSWLPFVGVVLFFLGFFRCIDAYTSQTVQGYLLNIQGGILDLVTGFLVLFSVNDSADYLNLLIVGYMVTQGIFRNVLITVANVQNPLPSRITGMISIILGILIWIEWPSSAPWFLALSISIDISFRGWALIMLASSLKKEPAYEE